MLKSSQSTKSKQAQPHIPRRNKTKVRHDREERYGVASDAPFRIFLQILEFVAVTYFKLSSGLAIPTRSVRLLQYSLVDKPRGIVLKNH